MKELTNGELTVINGGGERGLAKVANGLWNGAECGLTAAEYSGFNPWVTSAAVGVCFLYGVYTG